LAATMPFAVAVGAEVTAATPEEVRGRLAWAPERCTSGGTLHGGAIMALADTLGAICAFLNLPPGAGTSTIESKTNFFAPVRSGRTRAAPPAGNRPPPLRRRVRARGVRLRAAGDLRAGAGGRRARVSHRAAGRRAGGPGRRPAHRRDEAAGRPPRRQPDGDGSGDAGGHGAQEGRALPRGLR